MKKIIFMSFLALLLSFPAAAQFGTTIPSSTFSSAYAAWLGGNVKFVYSNGAPYPDPQGPGSSCHAQYVPSVDGVNYQPGGSTLFPCRPFEVNAGANHNMHFIASFTKQSNGSYKGTDCPQIWAQNAGSPPIDYASCDALTNVPPSPPPPPPPAPCSYISGTSSEYTAGCIASTSCLQQPDGTFIGNCSATEALPGCFPTATTMCLDDQPKDKRFQVTVQYNTTQGGGSFGAGQVISLFPLDVTQGGLFWLFSNSNPEVLVKVLNACAVNQHVWVFASGTTNVGLGITVLDTKTKFQHVYTTPDVHAMDPIQDTTTFPCSQ